MHAITEAFYDRMRVAEPKLADMHVCDADGRVAEEPRRKFELFLIEWLGGPKVYSSVHGHPRLRMRHARFPVDDEMIRAWLSCMMHALDTVQLDGPVRAFLDTRLTDLANFMKNR